MVITNHTNWNFEKDAWDNPIYLAGKEADSFRKAWCRFRYEKEQIAEYPMNKATLK